MNSMLVIYSLLYYFIIKPFCYLKELIPSITKKKSGNKETKTIQEISEWDLAVSGMRIRQ